MIRAPEEAMRGRIAVVVGGVVVTVLALGRPAVGQQSGGHLNPMIDLLIAKKAILGLGVPSAGRGGNRGRAGRGDATPPAAPATPAPVRTPADFAKDALAHPEADFFFTSSMERNIDGGETTMIALQDALAELGNVRRTPTPRLLMPVNSKAPNISRPDMPADPANYVANISRQLNAGVSSFAFVEVDTAEELQLGIAAMRFASRGGTRPDNVGNAPKYWGLGEAEYRRRADVWPINPEGELVAWAIIESKEGLANIRQIAQVKGLSVLAAGAGTLGGVFSTTNAEGRRVRDDAAWEAAIQTVLAACREFKLACAYPVNENDVETRMQQGFNVAILQSFNDAAFRAVAKGRQFSGRDRGQ
jgi:4-hydroxy-2-oxoheptanedioate aldolase